MPKNKSNPAFKHHTNYGVLDVFNVPTKDLPEEAVHILAEAYRCMPVPPTPVHDCNWCGETCMLSYGAESPPRMYRHGLIDAQVSGGYESTPGNGQGALDDCSSYKFSLCEFCLDHLFTQFKIPPTVSEYGSGGGEYPFTPAAERVAKDDWRRMKTEFFTEYSRRAEKRCFEAPPMKVVSIDDNGT